MKKINKFKLLAIGALTMGTAVLSQEASAQSWQRVYASGQTNNDGPFAILPVVTGASNAVGSDLTNASNLNVTLLGSVWQEFTFSEIPDTNAIHVKIGKQAGLLSALGTVTVTAYDDDENPVGSQTAGSLLGLLNGLSQSDIVVKPTASATSVRVTYTAIAIGGGIDVYAAYFDKPATTLTNYNTAADAIFGASGALLTTSLLSSVDSTLNVIDGNEGTKATIRSLASAANTNSITALYTSLSEAGDSVRVVLDDPGGLLTLDLLASGLSINTYNGNTVEPLFEEGALLNLVLLPGATGKYVLTIPTTVKFDRIEVGTTGVLSTTYTLNVYEIGRKIPTVTFANDTVVYDGTALPTLEATLPNTSDSVVWFTSPSPAGTPVFTGNSYTLPTRPTEHTTYYAYIKRNGSIQAATLDSVYVQVKTLYVRPIVFLEGAYRTATGAMTTSLASNSHLPTTFLGATQSDINTLEVDGAGVVDWVTVELRDTTATHTLLHAVPGILFSNGRVLAPTTLDSVLIKEIAGTYIVLVKHRNHLGVAAKTSLNAFPTTIDFSLETTVTSAQNTIATKKMLYFGDLNHDNEINSSDFSIMRPLALEGAFDDYLEGDLDFNIEVNAIDFSKLRVKTLLSPFIDYSEL